MSCDTISMLLPPLPDQARQILDGYLRHLGAVLPLSAKHRRDLPIAIQELSQSLTSGRSDRRPDYLQTPRFQAAYCWYFLPWNLYRMSRLLTGLGAEGVPLKAGDAVLDVGAGPVTFAQALWIARPDLRDKALTIVCLDRAKKVMQTGRRLFESMAGPESPWKIILLGETLHRGLGHGKESARGTFQLVVAANVLNEALESGHGGHGGQAGHGGLTLADRVGQLTAMLRRKLDADHGRLLLVEPGVRLGGALISLAREGLLGGGGQSGGGDFEDDESFDADDGAGVDGMLDADDSFGDEDAMDDAVQAALGLPGARPMRLLAPCTHEGECPLQTRSAAGWCHLLMDVEGAPPWLQELSAKAKLIKRQASLSMLLAGSAGDALAACGEKAASKGRVVSSSFPVPAWRGYGRYVCAQEGLLLLKENSPAQARASGEAVSYDLESPPQRDAKSGALLATSAQSPQAVKTLYSTRPTQSRIDAGDREHEEDRSNDRSEARGDARPEGRRGVGADSRPDAPRRDRPGPAQSRSGKGGQAGEEHRSRQRSRSSNNDATKPNERDDADTSSRPRAVPKRPRPAGGPPKRGGRGR